MIRQLSLWLRTCLVSLFIVSLATCSEQPKPVEAIITAANPDAVAAGTEILKRGGSATDAAIAAMMVLSLVEPQSAGIGGGGFLLHYSASTQTIAAYDGREHAPLGAYPQLFLGEHGTPLPFLDAEISGRSIGTPLLVPMLKLAHDEHGHLPWAQLFEPAIALAEQGFKMPPRLHKLLETDQDSLHLRDSPDIRDYLFGEDGQPLPVGTLIHNPEFATTLRAIAAQGPKALTEGPIAQAIVQRANAEPHPDSLTLLDLQVVHPRRLPALCGQFRNLQICSMPPPSSGGVALIELLGLYERARPSPTTSPTIDDWAAYLWASRLAYVDRDYFVGDDQFIVVPFHELISPAYLDQRAELIDLQQAPEDLIHGEPIQISQVSPRWGIDQSVEVGGTTHLTIRDHEGNVVSLTATIENIFGSHRSVKGFFLNNQLTDFSFEPTEHGLALANAVAPGKRPRSSMAPTIILDDQGQVIAALGSPGGSSIVDYVAQTIIAMIDWQYPMQKAMDQGHLVASSKIIKAETDRIAPELIQELESRGWQFETATNEDSGLQGYIMNEKGMVDAAADSRRDGIVARLKNKASD